MAIVLDEATRAEYLAQTLASSRASGIVSALGSTVYCEVYDGANVLRASGTMASPWATSSGATITVGEVTAVGMIVSSGGVPDSLWYAQFRGSNGRFVRGTFGVSTDTTADFRWNQATFQTGSKGTLGTVTLTALGDTGLAPVLSAAPTLDGTAQVGAMLSCTAGTWLNTPTAYAYQWQRSANGSSGWSAISGATSVTYTVQSADLASYLRCAVTASNDYGSGTAFSPASAQVAAQPTGGTITTFQLTSSTSGTLPWAFGHAFKQGDVTGGVLADSADFQAVPTTYWSDGSVRHAIIAGRSVFASAGTVTVTLSRGTASNATALSTADLKAAIPAGTSVTVSGTTMTLSGTFLDSPQRTVCTGPVMSNWIYRQAVSGSNHLVIWCDVRLYKGGNVELFPWVENGYLLVNGPTNSVSACSVTVGGTSRFSQTIDIKHHTRVPLVTGTSFSYWTGTDPQIVPKHDSTYLIGTRATPNYGWKLPTSSALDGLQQSYTPNTLASNPSQMGNAGGSAAVLPREAALYVTSGDARAYRAAVVYGLSGGSWSTHYRDEGTNDPFRFTDRPNLSLNDGGSPALPVESGGENGTAVVTHQNSFGYLPWLVTGRWWFLEEHLFWVTWNWLKATPNQRRGEAYAQNTATYPAYATSASAGIVDPSNGTYTPRGAAWTLRSLAQAVMITPTSHACYAGIKAAWDANVGYMYARYVTGTYRVDTTSTYTNALGVIGTYSNAYGDATYYIGEGWQQGMIAQALGHAYELGVSTNTAQIAAVLDFSTSCAVGRTDGATGWNYRNFIAYGMTYGAVSASVPCSWYGNFTDAYTAYKTKYGIGGLSTADGLTLKKHSSSADLTSDIANESSWPYFGQALGALSYAVDRGVVNAQTGYLRVRGASNFDSVANAGFHNDPVYGIVPRVAVGVPSWVPAQGTFANISLNTLASVAPSGWPTTESAGPFANWSSGVYASAFGTRGAYVIHGSGHLSVGAALWAGVWCFDFETRQWVGRSVPSAAILEGTTPLNSYGESTAQGSLGHPYPPHTYDGLVYLAPGVGGASGAGALLRLSMAGSTYGTPAHRFDLNSTSSAPTRVIDALGGSSYPAAALDSSRGVIWYLDGNGNGPLRSINLSTWAVTNAPNGGYNDYGDQSLIYLPAPYDCLVGMGRSGGGGVNLSVWVSRIVNNVPQAFVQVTQSGTGPTDRRAGGVWSTLLNCIVSYQAAGSSTVHKLTPPGTGTSLTSGTWAWSTETLTGVGGATPSRNTVSDNGAWSRFIEVPSLRCFIWCDSVNGAVQAWRLTGM